MKKRRKIMVIGLGILGNSVAKTLTCDGAEVIAIDTDPVLIDRIKEFVAVAVVGDSTDPKVLEQNGAKELDAAVVCIGEEFEAAVLSAAHLLDLGVSHVAARGNNELTSSILRKIGVHDVFSVESEMGKQIAHKVQSPSIMREMELEGGFRICEWIAPDWMNEKTIMELSLPKHFHTYIVAIRENEESKKIKLPYGDTKIYHGNALLLAGHEENLNKLFHAKSFPK